MKKLHNFMQHLIQFTGLSDIAFSKGLRKNVRGSGIETYSLRTQEVWKHEFPPNFIDENGN